MISNCKFLLFLEPQQNIPKTAKKTAKSLTPLARFAYHQMNRPRELIFDVTKRFYGIFKRIEITAFAARSQLQINHEKESRKCWEANLDVWKLIWLRPFCGGESVIFQRGDGWGGRKKKEEKSARDLGDEKKARRASNDASAMIETTKKQPKKVKCEWLLTNNKWIQQQLHPQQSFPAAHQLQHPLTLLVFTRKCVVLNCGVEFRYARRLDSRLFAVKGAERRRGGGGALSHREYFRVIWKFTVQTGRWRLILYSKHSFRNGPHHARPITFASVFWLRNPAVCRTPTRKVPSLLSHLRFELMCTRHMPPLRLHQNFRPLAFSQAKRQKMRPHYLFMLFKPPSALTPPFAV